MKVYIKRVSKAVKLKLLLYLAGDGNIGKTTTLVALANALKYGSLFFYQQSGKRLSKDKQFVIRYNNKVIGIGTAGDNEGYLKDNIKFFKRQKCDIGITATRSRLIPFIKNNVGKTIVAGLDKKDVSTEYARDLVKAATVDQFVRLLSADLSPKKVANTLRQFKDFNIVE